MTLLKRSIRVALQASLATSVIALAACNKQPQDTSPAVAATAAAPAPASTAPAVPPYTPPTADQLYQLVAPIALFPDKLVAQVLAGSTHPDQITAADAMLQQNPNLTGQDLLTQVNAQPWDPSVKALTAFPKVLDQMASNVQWTTALGQAYANDPTDVMNAIQAMRQRAQTHGTLKSSQQQVVTTKTVTEVAPAYAGAQDSTGYVPSYSGPKIVPPPQQVIEIAPAQEGVVYVPQYNPEVVYGEPVGYYPGYTYVRPSYGYDNAVVAGVIGFGAGILVADLFHHHDYGWGWNSWGMRWGGGPPPPPPGGWGPGGPPGPGPGGWGGPAVVHNNTVYAPHNTYINNVNRTTVINNNERNFTNNGTINHYGAGAAAVGAGATGAGAPAMLAHPQAMRNQAMVQAAGMSGVRPGMEMAHGNVPNTLHPGPVSQVANRPMSMPNFGHTEAARYANPKATPTAPAFHPAGTPAARAGGEPQRNAMMRTAQPATTPRPEERSERRLPQGPQFRESTPRQTPQMRQETPRPMQPMREERRPAQREYAPQVREQPPREMSQPMREAPREMSRPQEAPRAEPRRVEHTAPHPQEHHAFSRDKDDKKH